MGREVGHLLPDHLRRGRWRHPRRPDPSLGGLKATRSGTTVYLTRYCIDIDDAPSLTGLVGAAPNSGARVELFDLDLTNLEVIPGRRHVTLKGAALTLTDDAATAPNGAFGDGAEPFAEGLPIGTARVTGRTWSRGG
jgi:hypothetical protein